MTIAAVPTMACVEFAVNATSTRNRQPIKIPIAEDHPQQPTNPYGWSKLFMERIMESYDRAYRLKFVALRYFNAAGASVDVSNNISAESADRIVILIAVILDQLVHIGLSQVQPWIKNVLRLGAYQESSERIIKDRLAEIYRAVADVPARAGELAQAPARDVEEHELHRPRRRRDPPRPTRRDPRRSRDAGR